MREQIRFKMVNRNIDTPIILFLHCQYHISHRAAFSTELTRREVLLEPISKIISDGMVAKAKEESQRSYVFDFNSLGDYTHENYVEERMSKSVVAGQVGDEKEKSLGLLLDILSDAIRTSRKLDSRYRSRP